MLTVRGRYAKTHSGQINVFRELFGVEPLLGRLFELRSKADYEPDRFEASDEELPALAGEVEEFAERCHRNVAAAAEIEPDEPDPPPDL